MLKIAAIGVLGACLLQGPAPPQVPLHLGCAYHLGDRITIADVYGDTHHLPHLLWDPARLEITGLVVMEFDSGGQHIVAVHHKENTMGGNLVFVVSYRNRL